MPAVAKKPKTSASSAASSARVAAPTKAGKPVKAAPAKPKAAPKSTAAAAAAKPKPAPAAKTKPKAAPRPRKAAAKIDPDLRRHYVEVAAYYIAERRGFLDGCETSDWCQAEIEIDRMLTEGLLSL